MPTMLSSGNSEGTIKNAFSPAVSFKLEKEKVIPLFVIQTIIAKTMVAVLNEISREV